MANDKVYIYDEENIRIEVYEEPQTNLILVNENPSLEVVRIYEQGPQGPKGDNSDLPIGIISSSQQIANDISGSWLFLQNKTGSYATTGSNVFRGNQVITGSANISGSIQFSLGSNYSAFIEPNGTALNIRHQNSTTHVSYQASNNTTHYQINNFINGVIVNPGGNSTTFGLRIVSGSYPAAKMLEINRTDLVVTGSKVGIGTNTPTGLLTVGAGSLSNPSLVLLPGSASTTVINGAVEYSNNKFSLSYYTTTYGAVRRVHFGNAISDDYTGLYLGVNPNPTLNYTVAGNASLAVLNAGITARLAINGNARLEQTNALTTIYTATTFVSGNLGVGTSNPVYNLEVTGAAKLNNSVLAWTSASINALEVGSIRIVDDPNGRYIQGTSGLFLRNSINPATNYFFVGNQTSNGTLSSDNNIIIRTSGWNVNQFVFSSKTSPTSYNQLTFARNRNDGFKQAIINSEDFAYSGSTPVDFYLWAGKETVTNTQGNLILQHDGTGSRGNVGIGTINPNSAALQVSKGGTASYSSLLVDGTWFSGGTATTTKPHILIEPSGTTSTGWYANGTALGINAATGFNGYFTDFQLNGTSKFYINSAGTLWTNGSLQAVGVCNFGNGRMQVGAGIFNSANAAIYAASGKGLELWSNNTSGSGIYITPTGTVGIGETNIAAQLQIKGPGATSSTYGLLVTNSGGVTATASLSVRDDGNVGIGTNAPTAKLSVVGTSTIPASFRVYDNGITGNYVSEFHADDASPWVAGFFNDTYSTSSPAFAYFARNNGDFEQGVQSGKGFKIYQGYGTSRIEVTTAGNLYFNATQKNEFVGDVSLITTGNKLKIATGTNASIGTATLVAGTVTVSTTAVTSSSIIFVSCNTPGGVQGILSVPASSIVNGTSFVINSSNIADTSTVNWWIIN